MGMFFTGSIVGFLVGTVASCILLAKKNLERYEAVKEKAGINYEAMKRVLDSMDEDGNFPQDFRETDDEDGDTEPQEFQEEISGNA